jgi:putative glutamine amidotransferase
MTPRIGITTGPRVHDGRDFEGLDRAYAAAVAAAAGLPLLLPTLDPMWVGAALAGVDGLVLSGGGDVDPARYGEQAVPELGRVNGARDEWELALVRAALVADVPVLAICRGCQVLTVATGGSLVQHLPAVSALDHDVPDREHEAVHDVRLEAGSALARIVGVDVVGVNSMHHQAAARLGDGLRAVGWSPDDVVEAVEVPDRPVMGVQWHPEHMVDAAPHRALFAWLVAEAARVAVAP